MKFYIKSLFVFAFCLIFSSCSAQNETPTEKPNVLLIILDDLNDYQGVFGGHPQAKTPNIDRLGQSGVLFKNAHTNVPVCQPSRNSLFTGMYPHNSRDFGWTPHFKQVVLKNHKTMIEVFKENGYETYGTGKLLHKNIRKYWTEWGVPEGINYGPHAYSGVDENGKRIMGHSSVPEPFRSINVVDGSFASFADTPVITNEAGTTIETGWTFGRKPYRYVNDNDRDLLPDEQHAIWASNKLKELEARKSKAPFFMGVGFVNPHTPLYAPQKYFDMFPLDEIQLPDLEENDVEDTFYASVYDQTEMGIAYYRKLKQSYPNGDEGLKRFLQAYLACVAFVDDQVGILLDGLENSEYSNNTVVILTSDHGWQMGEKDYLYKNSPWEESTRIPFIIRAPQISIPNSTVEHPVSLIDIFPTLKDVCGFEAITKRDGTPFELDGFSLKPFLENSNTKKWKGPNGALTVLGARINKPIEGLAVSTNPGALWHIEIKKDLDPEYIKEQNFTYRTKDWRYILYSNGTEELYNHTNDSFERINLALDENYNEVKASLNQEMRKIIYKNY